MTPVAKVRQAVMMTVSPSRVQAQSCASGSLLVSLRGEMSRLARSEAEEGSRCNRADFRNRSGSTHRDRTEFRPLHGDYVTQYYDQTHYLYPAH